MKVLIRLDDFTPNRDVRRWNDIVGVLDDLGIKPVVACIPDDRYFGTRPSAEDFWEEVHGLERRGWTIAVHGETHLVVPIPRGASPEVFFADKAEFVGLPEDVQLEKISRAWGRFAEQGLRPRVFVAPNHGFDASTVRALRRHGAMRIVSDGVSWRIFRDRELVWLPQLDWRMPRLRFGFRTVCLHPSTMNDRELTDFAKQAREVRRCFTSLEEIDLDAVAERGTADLLFSKTFELYMRTKTVVYRWSMRRGARRVVASPTSHD